MLHTIGVLNRDIYNCISENIITDEVIITDERIKHIMERHPEDYEKYYLFLKDIISDPDYIIETNKTNSALILKEFNRGEEKFKTIVRLITSHDNTSYKNSIITFMKINTKEWERLIRNKHILYKKE